MLLVIEFLDEFVYGLREAAWPAIRADLGLTYLQVGLLLSVPNLLGNFIEPAIGILGDVWKRRVLILGGGVVFGLALGLVVASQDFWLLLLAMILLYPASGAFVSLSQATLMDLDPGRHEQNMARWTFAGSVGVVTGALALSLSFLLGGGWREVFAASAVLTFLVLVIARRFPYGAPATTEDGERLSLWTGLRGAVAALRRRVVLRWLVLLQFSDLMLDGLHGYLALYFVDVAGASVAQGALAVAVWTGLGLAGDFLLIPLLERVRGLTYLRYSILAQFALFPAFLLAPGLGAKVSIVAVMGLTNAGWYAILQARLYTSMPGQSGTVLAVQNVSGVFGSLIPFAIGAAAAAWGLEVAIWLLMAGPVVLLVGTPRASIPSPSERG